MVKSIPKQLLTILMPFFDFMPPVIYTTPEQGSGSMFFNLMKQITELLKVLRGCSVQHVGIISSVPGLLLIII